MASATPAGVRRGPTMGVPRGAVHAVGVPAAALCLLAFVLSSAQALDESKGPDVAATGVFGPNGAGITPVLDTRIFGLDGRDASGVRVRIGQNEVEEPLATHVMLTGRTTVAGTPSIISKDHATGVASVLIGAPLSGLSGVAQQTELFSYGGTSIPGEPPQPFLLAADWLIDTHSLEVMNTSWGIPLDVVLNRDGNSWQSLYADYRVFQDDVVWVAGAGNDGPNTGTVKTFGDAYNVIAVGGTGTTGPDYTRMSGFSSRGPTEDGRHKPDIVDGTSIATPLVAGTAALLIERGKDNGFNHDHLTIKALLLNGASKHVLDPANGNCSWPETTAATQTGVPLDDAMGVGQLNAFASVRNYQAPSQTDLTVRQGTIDPSKTKTFDLPGLLDPGGLVTATLVWDRPVDNPGTGQFDVPSDYTGKTLPDLDLELLGTNVRPWVSDSAKDNVEHMYINVPRKDAYALRVVNHSNTKVNFALAWSAGSSDGLAFSVDRQAEGLATPSNLGLQLVNDVNTLGFAGPGHFPTEGEIFTSLGDGSNIQRFSGALGTRSRVGPHNAPPAALTLFDPGNRGVFGLQPDDNVVGLSWGQDGATLSGILDFSVNPLSLGALGSHVRREVTTTPLGLQPLAPFPMNTVGGDPGHEAAGDIFRSPEVDPFGAYTSSVAFPAPAMTNVQAVDEDFLGLQVPRTRGSLGLANAEDDLELDSPLENVDPDGDGRHNRPVFFLLDGASKSPNVGIIGWSADDIFVSKQPSTNVLVLPEVFADGVTHIKLPSGAALDALALSDVSPGLGPTTFTAVVHVSFGNIVVRAGPG